MNHVPAFPTDNERQTGSSEYHYEGMTLRDWFASKLMNDAFRRADAVDFEKIAVRCYLKAEAMMKARDKS